MADETKTTMSNKEVEWNEGTELDFLYLNEQEMIEAGVMDAGKCVDVMEEAMGLFSDGDYIMGGPNHNAHGLVLEFPKQSHITNFPVNDSKDRRFTAMPAYLGGRFHMAGEKWYGSNGRNVSRGIPRSILMVMLNDVETGAPLAFMSGNLLSAMRTGSMPGLAAKLLSKKNPKILTLVGAGVIARTSCMAILSKHETIDTIRIKGGSPNSRTAQALKEYIEAHYPQIKEITVCATLEEAVRGADIISEAASVKQGQWPVFEKEWLSPGTLVISASVFGMDHKDMLDVKKVVDDYSMFENYTVEDEPKIPKNEDGTHKNTGCLGEDFAYMVKDGLIERSSVVNIGDIVRGRSKGRESEDEIIFVAIEGMSIEDVAWGYECYHRAKQEGIGTKLLLWDKPHLC